jgi:hypothetical protein
MKQILTVITLFGLSAFLSSCAGPQRPVFYPNEKLNSTGKEEVKKDTDDCIRLSVEAGLKEQKGKEMAKETVKEGARGAAIGAVVGAITGDVGQAAAIGAAAGGTAGLMDEALDRELDPVQRGYVDQCLRERGYQPIGWK